MEDKLNFSFFDFSTKFNEVLQLMKENQLRKDLDDGLMEKLHETLQNKCTNGQLMNLLETTSLLELLHKTLQSVDSLSTDLNLDVTTFGLRAFGLLFKQKDIFHFFQKEATCLKLLSSLCRMDREPIYCSSIQAACLICITSLTYHLDGRNFLNSNSFCDMVFPSLQARSCYVRKDAIEYFSSFTVNSVADRHLNSVFHEITAKMISKALRDENVLIRNGCMEILKNCFDRSECAHKLLCEQFLLNLFQVMSDSKDPISPSQTVINLLSSCLICRENNCCSTVKKIHSLLVRQGFSHAAILLSTQILLRQCELESGLSASVLKDVIWPISSLIDDSVSRNVLSVTANKKDFMTTLCASITSMTKLAHLFNTESFSLVLLSCTSLLEMLYGDSPIIAVGGMVTKITLLVMDLFKKMFCTKGDAMVEAEIQDLLDCFDKVIDGPSECNVTCQVLKFFQLLILQDHGKQNVFQDIFAQSEVLALLERKLFDTQWPIVDSALEALGCVATHSEEGGMLWQECFHERSLHTIVWDIALFSEAEGYVRATAISVLTVMCKSSNLFERFQKDRNATADGLVSALCKLSEHSDIFIQRECINALTHWVSIGNYAENSNIHKILLNVVEHNLDCQSKLFALGVWKLILNHFLADTPSSEQHIHEDMQKLCNIGYVFCILHAISDSDDMVCCEAIRELMSLRQKLVNSRITEASMTLEADAGQKIKDIKGIDEKQVPFPVVSQEERDSAIEDVLNINTANQLFNILCADGRHIKQTSKGTQHCRGSILEQFWKSIWSPDMETKLRALDKSSDLYVNNPIALLDDIIAAKIQTSDPDEVAYQDIDCY